MIEAIQIDMSYREKIYQKYAERFQIQGYARKDVAERWAVGYRYFLRGWLPGDPGSRIADVGCGGGQLLGAFRIMGYRTLAGVDISEQQVARAQEAGFAVEAGDAIGYLRRHEGEFDLVTAIDIAEHLTKDELMEFLERAYAALRPGGRLILQMPNPNSPFGMRIRYGDLTHEVGLSPDCAERLLGLLGFEALESREAGPVPGWKSPSGSLRWVLWQLVRLAFSAFDLIETGGRGIGVFTRVYLVCGRRLR